MVIIIIPSFSSMDHLGVIKSLYASEIKSHKGKTKEEVLSGTKLHTLNLNKEKMLVISSSLLVMVTPIT